MSLSKSDFKLASICAKKLVYKKSGYATQNDASEFLEMLAQGGHIIGKYAQLMYPNGIEIKANSIDDAIKETDRLLSENEAITLFEATIFSNDKIVRIDILEKKNNLLNLIEVKSTSFDSDEEVDSKKKLTEYIEDVAFQAMVLREAFPGSEIHSYLLLPDKSKRTKIEGLAGWFNINEFVDEKFEMDELPAEGVVQFKKPLVEFKYENDPERGKYINQLREDCLLTLVSVDDEINEMMDDIQRRTKVFLEILKDGIKPQYFSINKNCKSCEFNLGKEKERNGFRECWQDLTDIEPSIFDLYSGGSIGHFKSGFYLDELISERKVSFHDLDAERFKNRKGELSSRGQRQLIQYENTRTNSEWIGDDLAVELNNLKFPLHFIDFECYLGAMPHHRNMRAYELVAFQWSCHTLHSPDSAPEHSEWLNTSHEFPNFQFAESLMKQIGDSGTPLIWSKYENTVLRNIINQMEIFNYSNPSLKDWLINITSGEDRESRFIDMNDLTLKYYFHPEMRGKTSIKKVLPAIWSNNPYLHSIPYFAKYATNTSGLANPYDSLSPIINELENEEVVRDGTGAMKVYNEILFGPASQNPERRRQLEKLLLQYCKLDTMAMIIIWKYWNDKCA